MSLSGVISPFSCDTFVALPPATQDGVIIFGKNSDRPRKEVQELVYCPAADPGAGAKLQCTYIEVDQVPHTHAVILSKPAWMWGAEMGSNEKGVCIGNEAVWTKLCGPGDQEEKLLGMDLVRLGLERGSTAKEAMDVITGLLQQHGQGGRCFEEPGYKDYIYQSSFLIADRSEAWVLETAGQFWAAKKITSGVYNMSNLLTIGSDIDAMSDGLKENAESSGYWKPADGPFDFAKAYGVDPAVPCDPGRVPSRRYAAGKELMEKYSKGGSFSIQNMFYILREKPINWTDDKVTAAGSMASILTPTDSKIPSCHWFTATPDTAKSVFKPFIFCPDVEVSEFTVSPSYSDDPVQIKPRFQKEVDRKHVLYKTQEEAFTQKDNIEELLQTLRELESQCVEDILNYLKDYDDESKLNDLRDILKDIVESEIKFYK